MTDKEKGGIKSAMPLANPSQIWTGRSNFNVLGETQRAVEA